MAAKTPAPIIAPSPIVTASKVPRRRARRLGASLRCAAAVALRASAGMIVGMLDLVDLCVRFVFPCIALVRRDVEPPQRNGQHDACKCGGQVRFPGNAGL